MTDEAARKTGVTDFQRRTPLQLAGIYARGVAIGATDLVPGVSGGTIALVMGIYYELVASIRALSTASFLGALRRGRIAAAFMVVNGPFLLSLLLGMGTAIVALSPAMTWLLAHRPVFVSAFFFGLVAATVPVVARRVSRRTWQYALLFAAGAAAAWFLVGLTPAETPETWWFLLLSGALAVSAFMLPGVSGAFVLVILGKYEFALRALVERDWLSIGLLVAGGLVGMLTFARVLTWLFRRWHDATLALMSGVVLGSLRKVWPWQEVAGELSVNLPPQGGAFDPLSGWAWALGLAVLAALLVLAAERAGAGRRGSPRS